MGKYLDKHRTFYYEPPSPSFCIVSCLLCANSRTFHAVGRKDDRPRPCPPHLGRRFAELAGWRPVSRGRQTGWRCPDCAAREGLT